MSRLAFTIVPLLALAVTAGAAPVPKAVKQRDDANLVLGEWRCESAFNGPNEMVGSHKGDVWVFAPPGEKSVQNCKGGTHYSLAYSFPTPGEKQMDVVCNGNPYVGVYDLDGDTLVIAFRAKDRPATLEKANGVYVFTFKREATK